MEFPRNHEFNKIFFINNRNSKNENNFESSINNKNTKINHLLTKINSNTKGSNPILIKKTFGEKPNIKKKLIKINKELLTETVSYENIENNNYTDRTTIKSSRYPINKKEKIISKKTTKIPKILKDNNKTEIKNKRIVKILNKNKGNLSYKKDIILNNNNQNNNDNNIKDIVTLLISKNNILKRNIIPNLKNFSVYNKNLNNSQNFAGKNKKNFSNLITPNNSTTNSFITKNYLKEKNDITNNNSNLNHNIKNILSPKQNLISKNSQLKNKINYNNKNNQLHKLYKFKNFNFIKKSGILKNFDSIENACDMNSSRSNYFKNANTNTNSFYNQKSINKAKQKIKYTQNNFIKNAILDSKANYYFTKKSETERVSPIKMSINNHVNNKIFTKKGIYDNKNNNMNNTLLLENSNIKEKNKTILNNKLNCKKTKKFIQKDKLLLLTSSNNIISSIDDYRAKLDKKYIQNIHPNTTRYKNINVNKTNINFNTNENTDRAPYKTKTDSSSCSFIKKIGNKLNYLNINLNNLSNMNNTIENINSNTKNGTIPTNINSFDENSILFKKKLKNKFLKKSDETYNDKSFLNSNNNIIILNNISMNNLNNISFDYLSKINKKNSKNNHNKFAYIRKQLSCHASKEKNKNISKLEKQLEKKREYYNNQKKIHKKKHNYKQNNRLKEQNLNSFNLKQVNNIRKHKFISHTKINSSINFSHCFKKSMQKEYIHKHNYSNNLNIMLNTNNINNNIGNNKIKVLSKNYSTSNNKTINVIFKNLREKIKTGKERIKINSANISSKKAYNNQTLPKKNIILNPSKTLRNSYKSKNNKIEKNEKENIVTEHNNYYKKVERLRKNCLSDINGKIAQEIKNEINSYSINSNNLKENEILRKSYKSIKTDDKKKNKNAKIKIIKKKKNRLLNILNNLNESINKNEKYIKKNDTEICMTPEISKLITASSSNNINPQQAEEYTTDIIESLLLEEDYYYNQKKYINPYYLENEDSELTPEMRTVAVDWLVLIHFKIFKFSENTLFLAIQIFDRYLSKVDLTTEETEMLLYTSFMLASKHNEIDYVNMQETLKLSQDKFSKDQIIKMESEILNKLDFEILAPTMYEFFVLFASFLGLSQTKINKGLYILNIVLVDFHMLKYPNFMLAFAVIKLITKTVDKNLVNLIKNILNKNKIEKFLNIFNRQGYEKICNRIKLLFNTFLETKYKNIQDKFSEKEFNSVSKFTYI